MNPENFNKLGQVLGRYFDTDAAAYERLCKANGITFSGEADGHQRYYIQAAKGNRACVMSMDELELKYSRTPIVAIRMRDLVHKLLNTP